MIYLLLVLAVVAGLRLAELWVSRRNWVLHKGQARLLGESLFPWMVLLHGSVFMLLPLEAVLFGFHCGGLLSWSALAVFFAALLLRVWTLATLGSSWNVRVVYGDRYPIVSHGPYAYIRHPNYLVVILELAAIPLMFHLYLSAVLLSLANALVLWVRIGNEESVLEANEQWLREMAHKPRFLPRFFSKS